MTRSTAARATGATAIVGLALLACTLALPSVGHADDDLATQVQNAKTAADHEAIAAEYDEKAADAKKEAEAHRKMEKTYATGSYAGGKVSPTPLPQHCAALAKHYDELAAEYTTLAAAHRAMAKNAK